MGRFTYILRPSKAKLSLSDFTVVALGIFAVGYHPITRGTSATQEDGIRGTLNLTPQF
jgi:hypothetical protein